MAFCELLILQGVVFFTMPSSFLGFRAARKHELLEEIADNLLALK